MKVLDGYLGFVVWFLIILSMQLSIISPLYAGEATKKEVIDPSANPPAQSETAPTPGGIFSNILSAVLKFQTERIDSFIGEFRNELKEVRSEIAALNKQVREVSTVINRLENRIAAAQYSADDLSKLNRKVQNLETENFRILSLRKDFEKSVKSVSLVQDDVKLAEERITNTLNRLEFERSDTNFLEFRIRRVERYLDRLQRDQEKPVPVPKEQAPVK